MKRNEKLILWTGILLLVMGGCFIASAVSWITLKPGRSAYIDKEDRQLDAIEAKKDALRYDPTKDYFWRTTIQYSYVRGTFPFIENKIDTLIKPTLMSVVRK